LHLKLDFVRSGYTDSSQSIAFREMMPQEIEAVFDGTALQLEVPLNLAVGTRVRIVVDSVLPNEVKPPKTFLQTAQSLKLQGEPDWSEKIDQYLYGETLSE
jgi:hypothetical protein